MYCDEQIRSGSDDVLYGNHGSTVRMETLDWCHNGLQAAEAEIQAVAEQAPTDPGANFKGKKSKAAAKQGTAKRQWEILRDSGIPESEIAEFRYSHKHRQTP